MSSKLNKVIDDKTLVEFYKRFAGGEQDIFINTKNLKIEKTKVWINKIFFAVY